MKLHHREIGIGKPLIILHGLFGYSDNWQSQAKKLAEYYRVILLDLRNHGHSDWSEDFSYELMSQDVYELFVDLKLEEAILLGHSMGGKVAIRFAQQYEDLLSKLVVVDIGIKEYPAHHDHILEGIHAVDLPNISSRKEAENNMSKFISSAGLKQFLLKNLYWKEKGKLAWRMNVKVLEREIGEIVSLMPNDEIEIPTLFVRGEFSNYILDEDIVNIEAQFVDVEFKTVKGAGHWVHSEAPDLFLETLLSFCLR